MSRYQLLEGFKVEVKREDYKLHLKGFDANKKLQTELVIAPDQSRFDLLAISARHGYVTIDALNWLLYKRKSILMFDEKGNLVTELHPYVHLQRTSKVRMLQYSMNNQVKHYLACDSIETKLSRMLYVLDSFEKEYDKVFELQKQRIEKQKLKINEKVTFQQLLRIEAEASRNYWSAIKECVPPKWKFEARTRGLRGFTQPRHAKDYFNAMLNYSYSVLASEITRACYATGFDPYFGFFHKEKKTLRSFTYDVIEPYRWLVDSTIILNSEKLNNPDKKTFIRTIDTKYGKVDFTFPMFILSETKNTLLSLMHRTFTQRVFYRGKLYPWTTIFALKLRELGAYLEGSRKGFSFSEP
jgi:CRISPR-associated protein Cas1